MVTIGTLVGTRLSGLDAERRAAAERRGERQEARRAELKKATEAYFFAAEHAQSASDPDVTEVEKRAASDQLWAAFKSLSLVSSEALNDAAAGYSDGPHQGPWNPNGEPAWKRVFEQNRKLTEVAREELAAYDS